MESDFLSNYFNKSMVVVGSLLLHLVLGGVLTALYGVEYLFIIALIVGVDFALSLGAIELTNRYFLKIARNSNNGTHPQSNPLIKATDIFQRNSAEADISQYQKKLHAAVEESCRAMDKMTSELKPFREQFEQIRAENHQLKSKLLALIEQKSKFADEPSKQEKLTKYREEVVSKFDELLDEYQYLYPARDLLLNNQRNVPSIKTKIEKLQENIKLLGEHHRMTLEFARLFLEDCYEINPQVQDKLCSTTLLISVSRAEV